MFDLSKYETVKERKKRFYADHPEGRLVAELINIDTVERYALFKAYVYLNQEDQEKNLPRGVGYALEIRETEKKVSRKGDEYEDVNYSSWVENCEESAVGRALDQAGYHNNKCSQEEMKKVSKSASDYILASWAPANKDETLLYKNAGIGYWSKEVNKDGEKWIWHVKKEYVLKSDADKKLNESKNAADKVQEMFGDDIPA